MRASVVILLACILLAAGAPAETHASGTALTQGYPLDRVPPVRTATLLLDMDTFEFEGAYRHEENFSKILLPDSYTPLSTLCYRWAPGFEEDTFHVRNLWTGQREIEVIYSLYWGYCHLVIPPDSLISHDCQHGFESDDPDTMMFVEVDEPAGRAIWELVRDTDHVNWVAENGSYEVAIMLLYTRQWAILACNNPQSPADLGCTRIFWPRRLVTRGVPVETEVQIHNFGDRSLLPDVRLLSGLSPASPRFPAREWLPADSSRLVCFEPVVPHSENDLTLLGHIRISGAAPCLDYRPENDTISVTVRLVDDPVFRNVSSHSHPGKIPLGGVPCDFDGDGDIDVFELGYGRLWQNDGTGGYHDITEESPVVLPWYTEEVVCRDFTQDGWPELLLCYFDRNPLFLIGTGNGRFRDGTHESGLLGLGDYPHAAAMDLELDGDLDLILASADEQLVLANNGTGYFRDVTLASGIDHPGRAMRLIAEDVNGDQACDILFGNWGAPSRLYISLQDGRFCELSGPWNVLNTVRDAAVLDLNHDRRNDVIIAELFDAGDSTHIYLNRGVFFDESHPALPRALGVTAGDFDRDGWGDIVLNRVHFDDGSLLLFKNEGLSFVDRSELLIENEMPSTSDFALWFIDMDLDQDLDLYSDWQVLLNQGVPDRENYSEYRENELTSSPYSSASAGQDGIVVPDPFIPRTSIRLALSHSCLTTLTVYDVQGRAIVRLVDQWLDAGEHCIPWNGLSSAGRAVPAGTYYYLLTTGDRRVRGTLTMIR